MLSIVQTILTTYLLMQYVDVEGCPGKWFGENCMHQCNCYNDALCNSTIGNCPGNRCAVNYFGPACQFYDMVSGKSVTSTESYITDANSTTCNPNAFASSIEVTINTGFLFMWLRLEVKDEKNILNFTVQFHNEIPCKNERKYPGNKFVDVTCDNKNVSRALNIIGPIAPDVCSIYISGGRNVALRQNATQSSTKAGNVPLGASNAVDGNTDATIFHGSCTQTSQQNNPTWILKYNRPQFLLSIKLFNRNYAQQRLKGFTLEAYAANGLAIVQYIADLKNVANQYVLFGSLTSPAISVRIVGYNHVPITDRVLTLCEVQTFGETVCPEGTYGLWCGEKCNCRNTEVCNPVTGKCATACNKGFYGLDCSLHCSNCLDGLCTRTGKCLLCPPGKMGRNCLNDCTSGFYGNNCTTQCSSNCLNRNCTASDGTCFNCIIGYQGIACENACPNGYYGQDCALFCGKVCKGGLCTHQEGTCLQCQDGFVGDQCENVCREGFFGANCETECPEHCFDVCGHVTGNCTCTGDFMGATCSECAADKFGRKCTYKCSILCKDQKCNSTTSDCLACDFQHAGLHCEDCAAFAYGEECAQNCSATCTHRECNSTTGKCFSCIEDYLGEFCEGTAENAADTILEHWWMGILLFAGVLLAIVGNFLLCERTNDIDSLEDSSYYAG